MMHLSYSLLPLVLVAVVSAASSTPSSSVYWGNVTGSKGQVYPTDVGFLGQTTYSSPPFLAQVDKLNTTRPNGKYGVEMRWLPKYGKPDNSSSDDIFRNLGQVSPYHPANDLFNSTNKYANVPDHCEIKQVHILHRHGARYPTGGSSGGEYQFGDKVRNATKEGKLKASGDLEFLMHWNYSLGTEVLTHVGAQELFDSGVKHYYQYAKLLENLTDHKPVIRTTSQSRMLDSARYWTLGFFGWDAPSKVNLEVLTETQGQNNTLAPYEYCTNADNSSFYLGDQMSTEWQKVYLKDAIQRLQGNLKGIELDETMVYGMMSICAYETVVMGFSNFCSLFTKEEFENYEYDIDLQFMGDYGFMNPTGRAQGIGWVVELLDRMNMTKFDGPATGQNTTLDENEMYFPVDQMLYADFTHDDVITSVLTALNYTQFSEFLPTTQPNPNRRYRSSRVTPFAARLVFEVLDCNSTDLQGSYVRTKINDAVIPMNQDQGCEARPDGLCKFNDFWKHQYQNAYKDSKYDLVCFGQNGTDFVVTGPVRNGTV